MIETVFIIVSLLTFLASLPQVTQLLKTKRSDEMNLFTWSIWAFSQTITFVYVIYIKNWPLILVNIAWVIFYFLMLALIIKYRPVNNQEIVNIQPEPVGDDVI
jgi:uncharacterized protein with PQ loop repeat